MRYAILPLGIVRIPCQVLAESKRAAPGIYQPRPTARSPSKPTPDAVGQLRQLKRRSTSGKVPVEEDVMRNRISTSLLLGILSAVLIGIGAAVAPQHLYLVVVLALAVNLASHFFSNRLVLKLSGAREVSPQEAPRLHQLVSELADRAGIPRPRVCVIPAAYANAFATGRSPKHGVVAVTAGLLHVLGERELRGVIAHELAHIKNQDIRGGPGHPRIGDGLPCSRRAVRRAVRRIVGRRPSAEAHRSVVATIIHIGISRSREYLADETGARLAGDPAGLADALATLAREAEVKPGQAQPATAGPGIVPPLARGERLLQLCSTHPPVQERVRRLRAMAPASGRVAA